jgi:hypothetical protein
LWDTTVLAFFNYWGLIFMKNSWIFRAFFMASLFAVFSEFKVAANGISSPHFSNNSLVDGGEKNLQEDPVWTAKLYQSLVGVGEMIYFMGGLPGIPVIMVRNHWLRQKATNRAKHGLDEFFSMPACELNSHNWLVRYLHFVDNQPAIVAIKEFANRIDAVEFPDLNRWSKAEDLSWEDDEILNEFATLAAQIIDFIPAACPATRVGRPPICTLNPVYDQLSFLRFRAANYLADYRQKFKS